MRFRQSQHGSMFFLPRPSDDERPEEEADEHWIEVLRWCQDQFGHPNRHYGHPDNFQGWNYFSPDRGYDQCRGIYFKDKHDATAFKLRWC